MQAQLDLDAEQVTDDLQRCRRCDLWKHATQAVPGEDLGHSSSVTVLASYHPSSILRAKGEDALLLRTTLIEDLARARAMGAHGA